MRKTMKQQRLELQQNLDHLNDLASRVQTVDPSIKALVYEGYDSESFILEATVEKRHYRLAIFFDIPELESVLMKLSETRPMPLEERKEAHKKIWEEGKTLLKESKELRVFAKRLNFPDAAQRQQQLMEESWNLMYQELSLCDVRPWIDFLGVLPGDVGVDMLGRHNLDTVRRENRDVLCADFNWVSGRYECTIVENFLQTYRRYGSVCPEQKYFVQLRTFCTDNVRNEWRKILHEQILPLMEEIKKAGVYSDRGCDLIQRARHIIKPWSVPRPWPPEVVKKKRQRKNPIGTKRADQISLL